jgi:hypothetical protein
MTWPAVTRKTSNATTNPIMSARIIRLLARSWGTDVRPPRGWFS